MRRLIGLLVVIGALCGAASASAVVLPAGFTQTTQWSGLGNPTVIRFAPDGKVFVASKSGIINVFDSLQDPSPTQFVDLRNKRARLLGPRAARDGAGPAVHDGPAVRVRAVRVRQDAEREPQPRWGDGCPTPPGGDRRRVRDQRAALAARGQRHRDRADRGLVPAVPEPLDGLDRVRAGRSAVRVLRRRRVVQLGRLRPGRQPGQPVRRPRGARPGPTVAGRRRALAGVPAPGRPGGHARRLDPAREPGHGRGLGRQPGDLRRQRQPAPDRRARAAQPVPDHVPAGHGRDLVRATSAGTSTRRSTARRTSRRSATTAGRVTRARRGWAPTTASTSARCETLYSQGAGAVTAPYYAYHHAEKVVTNEACPSGGSSISGLHFYTGALVPGQVPRRAVLQRLLAQLHLGRLQGRRRAAGHEHAADVRVGRPTARCGSPKARTARSTTRTCQRRHRAPDRLRQRRADRAHHGRRRAPAWCR